jgi:hypothetical protein
MEDLKWKLLEEIIRETHQVISTGNDFWIRHQRHRQQKLNYTNEIHHIRKLLRSKGNNRVNSQPTEKEKKYCKLFI